MKKSPKYRANSVLDFIHKGFVLTCVGLTIYSTTYLGYRAIHYFTVTRPQFKEQQRLKELSLLAEGSSDNLKDMAPNIF